MSKGNIFIIEDELEHIKLIKTILQTNDYTTFCSMTGINVINDIKENNIDLILLDISIPKINGFELCKKIKLEKTISDIPIIFVTGSVDIDSLVHGFKYGAVDYIRKPYHVFELLMRVKTHISLRTEILKNKKLCEIISMCANCKNIKIEKDNKIHWINVEKFLKKYNINVSHGICKTCTDKLYSEYDWFLNKGEV